VPLTADALVTLAEAKVYLGHQGDNEDPQIEEAINKASDYVQARLAWGPIKARTATWRLPAYCGTFLYAPIRPINIGSLVTITIDGTAQTVWRSPADDPQTGKDVIVASSVPVSSLCPDQFYRAGGWAGAGLVPDPIVLTYTGGIASSSLLPGRILEAFYLILGKFVRDELHQNPDTVSFSGPGGTVTRIDTDIPRRAREILESDRRVFV
jgi:hypothetical protein